MLETVHTRNHTIMVYRILVDGNRQQEHNHEA